jgi:hypothetical protein
VSRGSRGGGCNQGYSRRLFAINAVSEPSPQESDNFPRFVAILSIPHRQSVPELCLLGNFRIEGTERKIRF